MQLSFPLPIPEKFIWLNAITSDISGDTLSEKVMGLLLSSMKKMADDSKI